MTEATNRHRAASPGRQRSSLVIPLIVACSLLLAFTMVIDVSLLNTDLPMGGTTAESGADSATQGEEATSGTDAIETPAYESVAIGEYHAVSRSEDPAREVNIRLAAESIDGSIVQPGEIFSFNEKIGNIDEDDRYEMAPAAFGGGMETARGGGICQVSTALYMAALYANLQIEERHPHSVVVDYTPIGLDATVLYGEMDLRILNNTEQPISISATGEGQSVTVIIMGAPVTQGLTVVPISTLIEYHEAGTPRQYAEEWDPDLDATTYYIVESYREYYQNGVKFQSDFLSRDLYEVLDDTTGRSTESSDTSK